MSVALQCAENLNPLVTTMTNGPIKNAAQALRYWELRHQTSTHNLANTGTTGFKGARVFGEVLADGRLMPQTRTDFGSGNVTATGSPLDVALVGEGFLVVSSPDGERLIRGGSLSLDPRGRLVDEQGALVMTEEDEVLIPPGEVEIDSSGRIDVDGQQIARLRVVTVADLQALEHVGEGRFLAAPDTTKEVPPEDRFVRQGHLEESNTHALEGLIETITIQRAYGSVERVITELDATLRTIANDLARPV